MSSSLARELISGGVRLLQIASAVYLFREHVAEPTLCVGPSMLPTLHARGDVVILEPHPVRTGQLRVGDIVVARSPVNPRHTVCKRVAGLPGGAVDPWAAGGGGGGRARGGGAWSAAPPPSIPIPPGHVWLQGDNASNSTDSRAYGPVPLALVRGRVRWRVWPPGAAGRVDGGPGGAWAAQVYRAPWAGDGEAANRRPRY